MSSVRRLMNKRREIKLSRILNAYYNIMDTTNVTQKSFLGSNDILSDSSEQRNDDTGSEIETSNSELSKETSNAPLVEARNKLESNREANHEVSGDAVSDNGGQLEDIVFRRKKANLKKHVGFDEEDYKYLRYIQEPKMGKSKRIEEMGSEKIINDDDLLLAATLVHDAMEGRTFDIKTEPKYVRSYKMFKSWPLTYLLYLAIVIDLSLALFEEPAVQGFSVPYSVTISVEFLCLGYFAVRTFHNLHWRRTARFLRDIKNIFIIVILLLTVVDIVVYLIMVNMVPEDARRYTRALRPFVIVNFSDGRQIRRAWRNMRRTIKEIVHVLLLFYFFIFVFALIAYKMFSPRADMKYPDGRAYFKDYIDSVWDLYVLITTANNPDVMMPAVEYSRFYYIFFLIYVFVCFYLLLNVFLAVAYHSYNENLKEEIKRSSRDKKKKLGQAFDVIKINHNGEDMVTYRTWKRLMNLAKPKLSKNEIDLLMLILDMNRSGYISRHEFMNAADLLNVPVSEVDDRITWLEKKFPKLYNSLPCEYIKAFVEHVSFKIIYDGIVVLEVFLIAFQVNIDLLFSILFSLEIALKIFTVGPRNFFEHFMNWFDTLITLSSIVMLVLSYTSAKEPGYQETTEIVRIIRIFRVLRLLGHIRRFRIITNTLINISLSIVMYCGIVFIVFYFFAIIGIEGFKGKISNYGYNMSSLPRDQWFCGASEIANSSFYESRYCDLNFNDIIGAFLVLSTILFENNWHILTEGYVLVSGKAARVYFAVFFMCVSVVIMNIVTAFVVDMFMYEYTIQKEGKVDSTVEKKIKELGLGIDAETGLEISAPLSDSEMEELMHGSTVQKPQHHPWVQKSLLAGLRNADIRSSTFNSYVNKRKSSVPTLNRFDGIRFHIKKRGWRKIEALLQQLYEVEHEHDIDVTIDHADNTKLNEQKTFLV